MSQRKECQSEKSHHGRVQRHTVSTLHFPFVSEVSIHRIRVRVSVKLRILARKASEFLVEPNDKTLNLEVSESYTQADQNSSVSPSKVP